MEERRSNSRCEVCGGPTKLQGGNVRCRNSMCFFNHREIICPSCHQQGPEVIGRTETGFSYTCKECLNTWET